MSYAHELQYNFLNIIHLINGPTLAPTLPHEEGEPVPMGSW